MQGLAGAVDDMHQVNWILFATVCPGRKKYNPNP